MTKNRSLLEQLRQLIKRDDVLSSVPDHDLRAIREALSTGERRPLPAELRERLLRILASIE